MSMLWPIWQKFNHLISCPSDNTSAYRLDQLEWLRETIINLGTRPNITNTLIHGVSQWTAKQLDQSINPKSPTFGSIHPVDIAITRYTMIKPVPWNGTTYYEAILVHYGERHTYYLTHLSFSNTTVFSSIGWSARIITTLWAYSFSIWEYRNGVLHGHTLVENETSPHNYHFMGIFLFHMGI